MGKLIEPMKNTAVDVTTMAGAVSAVVGKSIKDPFASRCLRTFINLAVNSPELYYPLPERDDDNATEFQLARQGYTKWFATGDAHRAAICRCRCHPGIP
jgi:hypothetical protein